jgi:hypothetical protein
MYCVFTHQTESIQFNLKPKKTLGLTSTRRGTKITMSGNVDLFNHDSKQNLQMAAKSVSVGKDG